MLPALFPAGLVLLLIYTLPCARPNLSPHWWDLAGKHADFVYRRSFRMCPGTDSTMGIGGPSGWNQVSRNYKAMWNERLSLRRQRVWRAESSECHYCASTAPPAGSCHSCSGL